MKINLRRVLALLLFGCLLNSLVYAQDRPKLGLVLSGGGAKGIAHIGALKAMEEAGLRPDFITGTSMGSVIGSLYALGYSADQIAEMVLDLDWNQVLSNDVPLNYIAFEEKEYYSRYLAGFPIYKGSIALSSGLIKGQTLNEVLTRYLWPSFQYDDFDDFPIPFRCVGTDVKTGDPIIFKDGPLPTAVRASMALPTAFTAVDLDTTLVVDGGVLDNFPVDVIQEMGADYIIGVNVSAPQSEIPESMLGILLSLATIPSEKKLIEEIKDCDIYLEPDMMGYTTASFGNAEEILQLGMDYGKQFKEEFEALAEKLGMNYEPLSVPKDDGEIRLSAVNVKGNSLFSDELIMGKLGVEANDKVSYDELEEAIRRVYGVNGFEQVDYGLHMLNDSVGELNIKLHEKLPQHLYVSVHADNVFAAGIMLNYTARDLLGKDSRTILAGDISKNPRFRFDYYKYVGAKKKLAFNARYDYMSEQLPYYEEGKVSDLTINHLHRAAVNVITTQSLRSSFTVGGFYQFGSGKTRYNVLIPDYINKLTANQAGLRLSWLRNNLNDRNFPTSGAESQIIIDNILQTQYTWHLEDEIPGIVDSVRDLYEELYNAQLDLLEPTYYFRGSYLYHAFFNIAPHTQVIPRVGVGVTLNWNDENISDSVRVAVDGFLFGGTQRVWRDDLPVFGLQYGERSSPNYALAGLKMQHILFNNFYWQYGADLLGMYEYNPIKDLSINDILESELLLGYGTRLTWRTPLGPISGGISWNNKDAFPRYYFGLGFTFNYSD